MVMNSRGWHQNQNRKAKPEAKSSLTTKQAPGGYERCSKRQLVPKSRSRKNTWPKKNQDGIETTIKKDNQWKAREAIRQQPNWTQANQRRKYNNSIEAFRWMEIIKINLTRTSLDKLLRGIEYLVTGLAPSKEKLTNWKMMG